MCIFRRFVLILAALSASNLSAAKGNDIGMWIAVRNDLSNNAYFVTLLAIGDDGRSSPFALGEAKSLSFTPWVYLPESPKRVMIKYVVNNSVTLVLCEIEATSKAGEGLMISLSGKQQELVTMVGAGGVVEWEPLRADLLEFWSEGESKMTSDSEDASSPLPDDRKLRDLERRVSFDQLNAVRDGFMCGSRLRGVGVVRLGLNATERSVGKNIYRRLLIPYGDPFAKVFSADEKAYFKKKVAIFDVFVEAFCLGYGKDVRPVYVDP